MVWAEAVCLKHGSPYSDCLPRLEPGGGALVGAVPPTGDRPGTCMLHTLTTGGGGTCWGLATHCAVMCALPW